MTTATATITGPMLTAGLAAVPGARWTVKLITGGVPAVLPDGSVVAPVEGRTDTAGAASVALPLNSEVSNVAGSYYLAVGPGGKWAFRLGAEHADATFAWGDESIMVDAPEVPVATGAQGPPGADGAPGADGVAAATAPLTYNAGTRTVGIDLGAITPGDIGADVAGAAAAAQAAAVASSAQRASNLSDLADVDTARANLRAAGARRDVLWTDPSVWSRFSRVVSISSDANVGHTYALSVSNGAGVMTGTSLAGSGGDRRALLLDGPDLADVELRLEFALSGPGVQAGVVARLAGNVAGVAVSNNVVFNGSGTVNFAQWEWDAHQLVQVQPLPGGGGTIDKRPGLSAVGDGTKITVQTQQPHMLPMAADMQFAGWGTSALDGKTLQVNGRPTASSFTVPSTTVGSWTPTAATYTWATYTGRRWLALRVKGNQAALKAWPSGTPEPAWGDPLACVMTNPAIPSTVPVSGTPAPASGAVGLVMNHLDAAGVITVHSFQVIPL